MHELGIMESALAAVLRQTHARHASRVHRIVLRIGAIAGVDPDALRFAFEIAVRDTPAAEATLEIISVPARAHCATCQNDFSVEHGFIFSCPRCKRLSGDVRAGRELELARIEIS